MGKKLDIQIKNLEPADVKLDVIIIVNLKFGNFLIDQKFIIISNELFTGNAEFYIIYSMSNRRVEVKSINDFASNISRHFCPLL